MHALLDSGPRGKISKIENPQDTELDICVNIMDPPPEDQNSQQGQGGNPNAYLSMRDRDRKSVV